MRKKHGQYVAYVRVDNAHWLHVDVVLDSVYICGRNVASIVARVKNIGLDVLSQIVFENTQKLFFSSSKIYERTITLEQGET